MEVTDNTFRKFNSILGLNIDEYFSDKESRNINYNCLKLNIELYKGMCRNYDEYTLKYIKNIVLACNKYSIGVVASAINESCNKY